MKIQRISIFILSLTWGVFFYFLITTDMTDKLDSMGDIGMFPLLIPAGAGADRDVFKKQNNLQYDFIFIYSILCQD